jgi:hypothetical protein
MFDQCQLETDRSNSFETLGELASFFEAWQDR